MKAFKFLILLAAAVTLAESSSLAINLSEQRHPQLNHATSGWVGPNLWFCDGQYFMVLGLLPNPHIHSGQFFHLAYLPTNPYIVPEQNPYIPEPTWAMKAAARPTKTFKPEFLPPALGVPASVDPRANPPVESPLQSSMNSFLALMAPKAEKTETLVDSLCERKNDRRYMKPINQIIHNANKKKMKKALDAASKAVFRISASALDMMRKQPLFMKEFQEQIDEDSSEKTVKLALDFNNKDRFLNILEIMPNRSLEKLTLHGEWVKDDFFRAVEHHIGKTDLVYLDLSFCPAIRDIDLMGIAPYLRKLEYLNLNFCSLITDQLLVKLNLPQIRYLELEGCNNITDLGLKHFGKSVSNLRTLNINGCTKITGKTFKEVASKFKEIRNINLKGCLLIAPEALEEAVKPFEKKLKFLEPPSVD